MLERNATIKKDWVHKGWEGGGGQHIRTRMTHRGKGNVTSIVWRGRREVHRLYWMPVKCFDVRYSQHGVLRTEYWWNDFKCECNFFSANGEYREVRSPRVNCVLSSHMRSHFQPAFSLSSTLTMFSGRCSVFFLMESLFIFHWQALFLLKNFSLRTAFICHVFFFLARSVT